MLKTGTGWDTVFGGPGCDVIYSEDGGDVIWGGDCNPNEPSETGVQIALENQVFAIFGTGNEPDNFTVIMDFWHETAMPHNYLCLFPDAGQGIPGSGDCTVNEGFDVDFFGLGGFTPGESCLTAVDVMSGRAPVDDSHDPKRTQGAGCKNDGGPLWIDIQVVDNPDDTTNSSGGGDVPRTLWARLFQKKGSKISSRRSRRSRYAQIGDAYPSEKKSDLV